MLKEKNNAAPEEIQQQENSKNHSSKSSDNSWQFTKINVMEHFCGKNTNVISCHHNTLNNITEKCPLILNRHPKMEKVVLYIGCVDAGRKQSEILTRDFLVLLKRLESLQMSIFISGSLPLGADEKNCCTDYSNRFKYIIYPSIF